VEREEMLDYLKGKIRRTEDEAALEEVFRLIDKHVGEGGEWWGDAADAAATSLRLDDWFGVRSPRDAAIAAFGLVLLAHGREESRAWIRGRLQESGAVKCGGLSLDHALVELSYLRVFACHYAIAVGHPQTDFRKSAGEAYLAGLMALAAFTVDPDHALAEQDWRFRLYGEAADADSSGSSHFMHVGDVFGGLCGVEDLDVLLFGQVIFSTTVWGAAQSISDFLALGSGGTRAGES
jgi:hypothetical protein